MECDIAELKKSDMPQVLELLETDGLRAEYVLEEGTRYWGAYSGGRLIGAVGCEYQGAYGLLRSAIVLEEYRGMGIGGRLTESVLQAARDSALEAVYLFSTDAGTYWEREGFAEVAVSELVQRMPRAYQVKLFKELGWLPTEAAYKYLL